MNNRIFYLVVGIVFLLLSLPSKWVFIPKAHMTSETPLYVPAEMPVTLTGTGGNLGVAGVQLPIWLVLTLAILALLGLLLNQSRTTTVPKMVLLPVWLMSALNVSVAFVLYAGVRGAGIGVGPFLAAVGLLIGLFFRLLSVRRA